MKNKMKIAFIVFVLLSLFILPLASAEEISTEQSLDYAIVYKQSGFGGIGKTLALGAISSTPQGAAVVQGIQTTSTALSIITAANPAAAIFSAGANYFVGQITSAAMSELAKSSPEIAKAYGIYQRLDALATEPTQSAQPTQTSDNQQANVLAEFNKDGSLKKLNCAFEKQANIGDLIRDDLKANDGLVTNADVSIDKEKGTSVFTGRKDGGVIRISDEFAVSLEENEKLAYTFDKKTGIGVLDLTKGSIKVGENIYKNLQTAKFKLNKEKQIEFAEFDATEISRYDFSYNRQNLIIEAKKDSHVKFDPKESKKIECKNAFLKYGNKNVNGDFVIDVDSVTGEIKKVTLLKLGSSYSFDKYAIRATKNEIVAIYFNGESITETNGISFSADKVLTKGNFEFTKYLSDKKNKVKLFVLGNDNSLSEIFLQEGKDLLSVKQGSVSFYSSIIGMPEGIVLSSKQGSCFAIADTGAIEWGSVKDNLCDKIGQAKNFNEFQSIQAKIKEQIKQEIEKTGEQEVVKQEDIDLYNEIKKQQTEGKINSEQAFEQYSELKQKYSGKLFEDNLDIEMAKIYSSKGLTYNANEVYNEIYSRKITRLEKQVSESPSDFASKSDLADMYRVTEQFSKAESEYESIVSLADSIKSSAASEDKKIKATMAAADALAVLSSKDTSNIDKAIMSYREVIAKSTDNNDIENARLNTALLRSEKRKQLISSGNEKESLDEGLKAIGELGAYSKLTDNEDKKKFAKAMQDNLRIELLAGYQKRAIELNDKESANNAKLIYEQLGGSIGFEKTAETIANNYEIGLQSASAQGFIDESSSTYKTIKKDLSQYKSFLSEIASEGKTIGFVESELKDIQKKELDAKDAQIKKVFDELSSKLEITSDSYAVSREIDSKRNEVYNNDEILQSLIKQKQTISNTLNTINQLPEEQKDNFKSLEGQRKGELVYVEGLIGQRKEKLTGEKDADAIIPEVFELMDKKKGLEEKMPKIPIIGRAFPSFAQSIVSPRLSKEITSIDEELTKKSEEWNSRLGIEEKYNPFTGTYENIVSKEGLVSTPLVVPNEIALSVGEIYFAAQTVGLGTAAIRSLGSKTALALVTEQGAKVVAPSLAKKLAIDSVAFHISDNLIKIGLGEDADWSPGAFADTAVTFGLLGCAGIASSKTIGMIPGTTVKSGESVALSRAGRTALKIASPAVETISLTGFQIAEEVAKRNFDVSTDNLAFIAEESLANNAAFIGAMKMAHYSPTIKAPAIKSIKIPEMESSIKNKMNVLQEIKNNPQNYENNLLKESVEKQFVETIKEVMSSQTEWIVEYKKQNNIAYEVGELNKKQHSLNKAYVASAETELNFNKKLFEVRQNYYSDKTVSSEQVMKENPVLIDLKTELLTAQNNFLKEQSKQKIISSEEYKIESKAISESVKELKNAKISIAKNEKAIDIKEKNPDSLLTQAKKAVGIPLNYNELFKEAKAYADAGDYAKAEPLFKQAIDKALAQSKEHVNARAQRAKMLFKSERYQEATAEYDTLIKEYNEYPAGDITGLLPEYAKVEKASAEALSGEYKKAIEELKAFESEAKVIPVETIKLIEEKLGRNYLEKTATPEFIETNFKAIGVSAELIAEAKANPAKRYDIAKQYINEPALMAAGISAAAEVEAPVKTIVISEQQATEFTKNSQLKVSLYHSLRSAADKTSIEQEGFKPASEGDGIYFSLEPDTSGTSVVLEAKVDAKKVLDYRNFKTGEESLKYTSYNKLRQLGYDAVIRTTTSDFAVGGVEVVVLNPSAIRVVEAAKIPVTETPAETEAVNAQAGRIYLPTAAEIGNVLKKPLEWLGIIKTAPAEVPVEIAEQIKSLNERLISADENLQSDAISEIQQFQYDRRVLQDSQVIDPLLKIFKENEELRITAGRALGKIKDPSLVDKLNALVKDPASKISIKINAVIALGEIGDKKAVEPLTSIYQTYKGDYSNELKNVIVMAFGKIKSPEPEAIRILTDALNNGPNFEVKYHAADALGKIGDTSAVPALISKLSSKDATIVRNYAAQALGEIGDKRALDSLKQSLNDPSETIRATAAKAIAKIEVPVVSAEAYSALSSDYIQRNLELAISKKQVITEEITKDIEFAAADYNNIPEILEKYNLQPDALMGGTPAPAKVQAEVAKQIELLSYYDDYKVQNKALKELIKIGKPAVPALIEKLNSMKGDYYDPQFRLVLNGLGKIGPDAKEALPILTELSKVSSIKLAGNKIYVLDTMLKIDINTQYQVVPILLGESNSYEILYRHGKNILPVLEGILKDSKSSLRTKQDALYYIGTIKDPSAVSILIEVIRGSDLDMKLSAIDALREIGDKRAILVLVELLKLPSGKLRQGATDALVKIGKPAVPSLISLLGTTKDSETKSGLISVLGDIRDVSAVPALTEALKDPNLQYNSLAALARIGPDAKQSVPEILRLFNSMGYTEKSEAISTLGYIRDARAIPALTEALKDSAIATPAYHALTHLGEPAVKSVINLLKENNLNKDTIELADFVIEEIGRPAIPLLIESLDYENVKDVTHSMMYNFPESFAGIKNKNLEALVDESIASEKSRGISNQESSLKYVKYYNALAEGTIYENSELFPHQSKFKELFATGKKRALIVHNIKDGQGDELIRMNTLVQGLRDYNPNIEFTIYTGRSYLYSETSNVHIKSIEDLISLKKEIRDFDIIVDHYDVDQKYSNYIGSETESIIDSASPKLLIKTDKSNDNFLFRQVILDNQPIINVYLSGASPVNDVYSPVSRLSAEFGLPLRYGTMKPKERSLILGEGNAKADSWWKEKVVKKNTEKRKVISFNGFGGENAHKGYENLDEMAEDIGVLISTKNFVVIYPNDAVWGDAVKANEVYNKLTETQKKYVVVTLQPSEALTSIKYWIDKSDKIVTVEGGMMHLAYNLGKPFTVILKQGAGPAKWMTSLRSSDQDIIGLTKTTEDIRRVGVQTRIPASATETSLISKKIKNEKSGILVSEVSVETSAEAYKSLSSDYIQRNLELAISKKQVITEEITKDIESAAADYKKIPEILEKYNLNSDALMGGTPAKIITSVDSLILDKPKSELKTMIESELAKEAFYETPSDKLLELLANGQRGGTSMIDALLPEIQSTLREEGFSEKAIETMAPKIQEKMFELNADLKLEKFNEIQKNDKSFQMQVAVAQAIEASSSNIVNKVESETPEVLAKTDKTPKGMWTIGEKNKKVFMADNEIERLKIPKGIITGKWPSYATEIRPKVRALKTELGIQSKIILGLQGSAATGVSSKTGKYIDKPGDFDFIFINNMLFDIVMRRAMTFAKEGTLTKGKTIEEQISYVNNFESRGEALIHDPRLLPEFQKRDLYSTDMERKISIKIMISKTGTPSAKRYMIEIAN